MTAHTHINPEQLTTGCEACYKRVRRDQIAARRTETILVEITCTLMTEITVTPSEAARCRQQWTGSLVDDLETLADEDQPTEPLGLVLDALAEQGFALMEHVVSTAEVLETQPAAPRPDPNQLKILP